MTSKEVKFKHFQEISEARSICELFDYSVAHKSSSSLPVDRETDVPRNDVIDMSDSGSDMFVERCKLKLKEVLKRRIELLNSDR